MEEAQGPHLGAVLKEVGPDLRSGRVERRKAGGPEHVAEQEAAADRSIALHSRVVSG